MSQKRIFKANVFVLLVMFGYGLNINLLEQKELQYIFSPATMRKEGFTEVGSATAVSYSDGRLRIFTAAHYFPKGVSGHYQVRMRGQDWKNVVDILYLENDVAEVVTSDKEKKNIIGLAPFQPGMMLGEISITVYDVNKQFPVYSIFDSRTHTVLGEFIEHEHYKRKGFIADLQTEVGQSGRGFLDKKQRLFIAVMSIETIRIELPTKMVTGVAGLVEVDYK